MIRGAGGLAAALALLALAGSAAAKGDAIVVYTGYGDGRGAVVEGRVIGKHGGAVASPSDGRLDNLARNLRLLRNDERKHRLVEVSIGGRAWATQTDQEGYFRIEVGAEPRLTPGWHGVGARSGDAAAGGEVLIVPPGGSRGLISDLDDTLLVSEVTRKPRLLANTFLKNPTQRRAVPGMARLYDALAAQGVGTFIYLSASPRQLHQPIADFLARHRFPQGVLITKRVSDDGSSEPLVDQFAYKTARIEELFSRLPGVRFVLVGDDGERDPEIYDWVRRRYPERVEAVWIRRIHPDPARPRLEGQRDVAEVLTENMGGDGK